MDSVKRFFAPEFLNRLDEIVIFNPLGRKEIDGIVDIQLEDVRRRLVELGLTLELSPEARDLIAETGFDSSSGARHLRRTIQRLVEDPLTDAILLGEFSRGDSVVAGRAGERLVFTRSLLPEGDAEVVPATGSSTL
jgi:ATP-dependent Clp protease ATP-binding subunit ClpA